MLRKISIWSFVSLLTAFAGNVALSQRALPPDPLLVAENEARKLRPSYQVCIDSSMAATPVLLDCSAKEFIYQDRRLNLTYKKLMASISSDARISLREDERAWLLYKQKLCTAGDEPGQFDLISSATCEVVETAKRANELAKRLP